MPQAQIYSSDAHSIYDIIKLIFRGLIPIVLVVGGISLIFTRLAGWSVVLGLPMIVIGTVFLIFTYDEVVQKSLKPLTFDWIECDKCGQNFPIRLMKTIQGKKICPNCRT